MTAIGSLRWTKRLQARYATGWRRVRRNSSAAQLYGINVNRMKMAAYVIVGVFTALSGRCQGDCPETAEVCG